MYLSGTMTFGLLGGFVVHAFPGARPLCVIEITKAPNIQLCPAGDDNPDVKQLKSSEDINNQKWKEGD